MAPPTSTALPPTFVKNATQQQQQRAAPPPSAPAPPILTHPYLPIRVSFVNGIHHTEEEWRNLTLSLSRVFGDQVRAFYNPSSGWWINDAAKAGYELVRRPNDLGLAKKLAEHLRSVLKEVGPTGRVLHLAHSGGAILTYLAAKYHLTSQETDRIDLATFGGGRSITRKYFRGRIINYYSRNDPLTLVDGRAGALMKYATKNNTYCEVRDRKHNTTFVYLQGLADHPLRDHSMFGPTYILALQLEAANFRERLSMMTTAISIAEANWVRRVRKATAKATGLRHFWGNSAASAQSSLRLLRKRAAKITKKRGYFSGGRVGVGVLSGTGSGSGRGGGSGSGGGGGDASVAVNGSGSLSIPSSWRAKLFSRLGKYYPSSAATRWLSTVSSSEAVVEDDDEDVEVMINESGQKNATLVVAVQTATTTNKVATLLATSTASLTRYVTAVNATASEAWVLYKARLNQTRAVVRDQVARLGQYARALRERRGQQKEQEEERGAREKLPVDANSSKPPPEPEPEPEPVMDSASDSTVPLTEPDSIEPAPAATATTASMTATASATASASEANDAVSESAPSSSPPADNESPRIAEIATAEEAPTPPLPDAEVALPDVPDVSVIDNL